ncbi:hypothetical protein STCU_12257 [Strigomonas culicis]|uniref:Uncharacterized protein n=1 Tax=Strigomonas culicis TaxID=28005 RepID=S9UXE3_9TRYP|nr:hypothetical protein STCU_12257 [Strigomonas culicis]|eukprot:EPY15200.1 hypothetical protein STCU_12257 [Strigomonas culicis]
MQLHTLLFYLLVCLLLDICILSSVFTIISLFIFFSCVLVYLYILCSFKQKQSVSLHQKKKMEYIIKNNRFSICFSSFFFLFSLHRC